VHPSEQWVQAVVVVVDLDAGLVGLSAGDSTDILHHARSTRDREGEEESVESGKVEAFAEVGAGGQEQDRCITLVELFEDGLVELLPGPSFQHGSLKALTRAQLAAESFEMLGAVGEDENVPAPSVRVGDVLADGLGSSSSAATRPRTVWSGASSGVSGSVKVSCTIRSRRTRTVDATSSLIR
jgi:hypothetical protein